MYYIDLNEGPEMPYGHGEKYILQCGSCGEPLLLINEAWDSFGWKFAQGCLPEVRAS